MHRLTISRLTLVLPCVFLFIAPRPLAADSDGYYCTGPGYLAYELRWTNRSSGHELHIVRYSEDEGIVSLPPIILRDFQVYDMDCLKSSIRITSSAGGYVIDLSDPTGPHVAESGALSLGGPPGHATPNLGHWGRTGVVDLESDAGPGTFQLVIARAERPIEGGIERYTLTTVVRRNPLPGRTEHFEEAVVLFQGIFLETID